MQEKYQVMENLRKRLWMRREGGRPERHRSGKAPLGKRSGTCGRSRGCRPVPPGDHGGDRSVSGGWEVKKSPWKRLGGAV